MSLSSDARGFFFFNDTATTEIYTLSLHDALPIWATLARISPMVGGFVPDAVGGGAGFCSSGCCGGAPSAMLAVVAGRCLDRKSTRLNSSHLVISYAVFCLKKKNHQTHRSPNESRS